MSATGAVVRHGQPELVVAHCDDPGNPTLNYHCEERSNHTHESTTDPEARLARKSAGDDCSVLPLQADAVSRLEAFASSFRE